MRKFFLVLFALAFLGGAFYMARFHGRREAKEVHLEKIGPRELTATVSASGKLRAHREVEISANTMGRITRLAVREGTTVAAGDFLLMIDPVPFETTIARLKAVIALEEANLRVARAGRDKAASDYERDLELSRKGMAPPEQVAARKLALEVKEGEVTGARLRIEQQQANLVQAEHEYSKVRVHAPIAGIVTQLNIEEGENVVTGTMNNPGTVLMKISDMATLEVELEVDETEVVHLREGQKAKVRFDAFPDREFEGRVGEIAPGPEGAGALAASTGARAVRYLVVVTVVEAVPGARIGLSASAEIVTAVREKALAVPISAVTVREFGVDVAGARIPDWDFDPDAVLPTPALDPVSGDPKRQEFQGVFVRTDEGLARYEVVKIGIAGDRYFEVIDGLAEGAVVVTGPYEMVRELKEGDLVEEKKKRDPKKLRHRRRRRRRPRKDEAAETSDDGSEITSAPAEAR